jgi:flagellar basal body rod protein FlgG
MNAEKFYYFPQLLIPLKEKDQFILPQEHNDYLVNNLKNVNEILIIGWKGTENKFLELLKHSISNKPVNITSVNAGFKDIETTLKSVLPNAIVNHYLEGHNLRRTDNTFLLNNMDKKSWYVQHPSGSFSSYIIGLLQNKNKHIFQTK